MSTPAASAASKLASVLPGAIRSAPLWPTRLSAGMLNTRRSCRPRASGGQGERARALAKPELEQQLSERSAHHRLAVDALQRDPLDLPGADMVGQRLECCRQARVVRVGEGDGALPRALQVQDRL